MASTALLRRKRTTTSSTSSLFDYLTVQNSRTIQDFSTYRQLESSLHPHHLDPIRPTYTIPKTESKLIRFSPLGFRYYHGLPVSGWENQKSEYAAPSLGVRFVASQSTRNVSTATTKVRRPEDEENEYKVIKETSPEDCDQEVEGLSTAKAKAKEKQFQESQKGAAVMLVAVKKVWATVLGIGPALRAVASMSRADWAIKLSHWKDEFKETMQHYWLGTKLLWKDAGICSRLLVKLAGGKSLSRRERQQLTRTTADIFRLVPFVVFIIVPFMEFLLPVALKLFPNMMPSTFKDKMKEQEALKRKLLERMEYAKFLQDTIKEMAKEVQNSRTRELKKTAEEDAITLIKGEFKRAKGTF